jgi:hypothetical protein
MVDVTEIEKRVDRAVTASIPVAVNLGGINPENYGQVMEFAKTMATCRAGIPDWLRTSVGDCLMICTRAMRWGMDPFFVAEKSYLMVGKGGATKIGYESQLVHAVIESLAPLKNRLRHEIVGDGDDRRCRVWGTFKGEDAPHIFLSEPLGKRIKDIGRSDAGHFRGSPLWLQKPEVQLFYDASRDWARLNCPDVLAGVYTRDELPDMEPVDVTPKPSRTQEMAERLRNAKKASARGDRGFDHAHVENEVRNGSTVIDESVNHDATTEAVHERDNERDVEGRAGDSGDGGGHADDKGTGAVAVEGTAQAGETAAGTDAPQGEVSGEVIPPDSKEQKRKRK